MLVVGVRLTVCVEVLMIFKMIDVSCDRRLTKLELLKFFTR